jgi:hypothetical protein
MNILIGVISQTCEVKPKTFILRKYMVSQSLELNSPLKGSLFEFISYEKHENEDSIAMKNQYSTIRN